jgi:fatty acyl-CoA reductase
VADVVPVDIPVNMMIATAWHTVLTKPKDVPIYHCTTGGINPFTWGEMGTPTDRCRLSRLSSLYTLCRVPTPFSLFLECIALQILQKTPFEKALRRPSNVVMRNNPLMHEYWVLCSHLIPAYMVDFLVRLVGRKP